MPMGVLRLCFENCYFRDMETGVYPLHHKIIVHSTKAKSSIIWFPFGPQTEAKLVSPHYHVVQFSFLGKVQGSSLIILLYSVVLFCHAY